METIDYKQKIKDYMNSSEVDTLYKSMLNNLFPELKESENKRMIQYFKDLAPFDKADELYEKYGFSHKDAIAWLEKQGEHANFRNKIQIGDKVTRNEDGVPVNLSQLKRVAKKDEKQDEQKSYASETMNEKWDFDSGFTRMMEKEQKPAEWSEEIEAAISLLKHIAEEQEKDYCPHNANALRKAAQYLESISPQSQWKPSDEQMNTLEYYMHTLVCNEHKEILFGLYTNLKKLKQ